MFAKKLNVLSQDQNYDRVILPDGTIIDYGLTVPLDDRVRCDIIFVDEIGKRKKCQKMKLKKKGNC